MIFIRNIPLPVEKLVEQFKNPQLPPDSDASMLKSFDLMYISKGIDGLTKEVSMITVIYLK